MTSSRAAPRVGTLLAIGQDETPAMWLAPGIVPGSSLKSLRDGVWMSMASYSRAALLPLLTAERLGSYARATNGATANVFRLYEWNMRACASVLELSSMVEVVTRNALDREMRAWAASKGGGRSWFDAAPLDQRGRDDMRKARERASRRGQRPEVHGRVVAELSLGFWRYLVESRYLTSLWVPATRGAFPHGNEDVRKRQREVAFALQQMQFVRNRAAHHEPLHARALDRDYELALNLMGWISPDASGWVSDLSNLPQLIDVRHRLLV